MEFLFNGLQTLMPIQSCMTKKCNHQWKTAIITQERYGPIYQNMSTDRNCELDTIPFGGKVWEAVKFSPNISCTEMNFSIPVLPLPHTAWQIIAQD